MATNGSVSDELLQDSNFSSLASKKTDIEDFTQRLEEHVGGYTQKKTVVDALKDLITKVEAAENKLSVIKAVGKAKTLEPEEKYLCDHFTLGDLREKVKVANAQIDAMLDAGKVTPEEKPKVLENLNSRKATAKAADKAKLVEKLDRHISAVAKAVPFIPPVANLKEIDKLWRKLKEIEAVEKKPAKSVTAKDRELLGTKAQVQSDVRALESRSRMWFETEFEFKPRLSKALEQLAINEAENRRKEEEEAWQRKLKEEEEELERRRLEEQMKMDEQSKKVMEQLEARRLEAQARPQKAAPQPKKKEKKQAVRLDPKDLFVLPPQGLEAEAEAYDAPRVDDMVLADVHVEGDEDIEDPPEAEEAPAPEPEPKPAPAPKPKPTKAVVESKKENAEPTSVQGVGGDETIGPSLLQSTGPTLADAVKPVKKTPAPQPKKKEKKKFTKVSVTELGFD